MNRVRMRVLTEPPKTDKKKKKKFPEEIVHTKNSDIQ